MRLNKGTTNNIVIQHIKSNTIPQSVRGWRLEFFIPAKNKTVKIGSYPSSLLVDTSPNSNSYHLFENINFSLYPDIDDGVMVMRVYEVDTTDGNEVLYATQIVVIDTSDYTIYHHSRTDKEIKQYKRN